MRAAKEAGHVVLCLQVSHLASLEDFRCDLVQVSALWDSGTLTVSVHSY